MCTRLETCMPPPVKRTCTGPHPLPQTHMNPELSELKEITLLTMFHKVISVQDILSE